MIDSEDALNERLASLPGAPPIAWPNVNASPDTPYLEVAVFRNVPVMITLQDYARRPGIYQVTVVAREGSGSGQAGAIAESIRDHFPPNLTLPTDDGRTVRITNEPQVAGGIQDQGQYRLPVSIYYSDD